MSEKENKIPIEKDRLVHAQTVLYARQLQAVKTKSGTDKTGDALRIAIEYYIKDVPIL